MTSLRTIALASSALILAAASTQAVALPDAASKPLKAAYETKNEFVIGAVAQRIKEEFALEQAEIDLFIAELNDEAARIAAIAPAAGKKKKEHKTISGKLDAGLNLQNGNTKEQQVRFAGEFKYDPQDSKWANITTFRAENNEAEGVRSNEEYRLNNQTRWKFSEKEYAFFALDYVSDRFSGFDSRFSQTIGYGRELYSNDNFTWTGEVGAGARQTELTNGDKEDSVLGTIKTKGEWQITENLSFTQKLQSEFTSENVISESDSELKSNLSENLYLTFGVNIEHIGDAPAGASQTDTRTRAAVGYSF